MLSYVLPLRWSTIDHAAVEELTGYLRELRARADVLVVDGSPPEVFSAHALAWSDLVRHRPPDPRHRFVNGKVNGVHTGVAAARHEHVVIADDDVRHTPQTLAAIDRALHTASLVRPQNYFDPMPWHARWDTGRILLNRALGADYPGTLGVRRTPFLRMGGYDGDVLFENLQLIRTVQAFGGRTVHAPDVYVRRLPPTARRFWEQRVRQAYDEFAQPLRMAAFLAVWPAAVLLPGRGRVALALGTVALAEIGRRRAGGTRVFPASATLMAPVWLLERGTCAWLAVARRVLFGGVRYAGGRIRAAGRSPDTRFVAFGPGNPPVPVRGGVTWSADHIPVMSRAPAHWCRRRPWRSPRSSCSSASSGSSPESPRTTAT